MLEKDLERFRKLYPKWGREVENIEHICLLSPNNFEYDIITKIFPEALVHISIFRD